MTAALEVWNANRDEIRLVLGERLLRENPRLKVVYRSDYSSDVVGKGFLSMAGGTFLAKPFQAEKLAQTIRDSLDKPAKP